MTEHSGLPDAIVSAVRQSLDSPTGFVALHEPIFAGREKEYLIETIDSTFVSSVGKFVDAFEAGMAEYTGAKRAVAVSNGTSALHAALIALGVGRDDEVLMPALTFVATANAVLYAGAIPHFVDSEMETLGLDPDGLADYLAEVAEVREGQCWNRQTGRRIAAVVPMHTFGHPMRIERLLEVAERYGILVIEDAAESLGSSRGGKHTGRFGRCGVFSFNGNKTLTTGGGGAIITDDPALGDMLKHLTTTAKRPHKWMYAHDMMGFNYRMPNVNAALGCAQLEQLSGFLERKQRILERYVAAFSGLDGVTLVQQPPGTKSNYWLQAILLGEGRADQRDAVLEALNGAGLMSRPVWELMPDLPFLASSPSMPLPVARSLASRLINIPSNYLPK